MIYNRSRQAYSALQQERLSTKCNIPKVLTGSRPKGITSKPDQTASATMQELFPWTHGTQIVSFLGESAACAPLVVGVILSGGQAPGGHNVIGGLYDALKRYHPDSQLIGFLDGPHGLFSSNYVYVTDAIMAGFRNTGGFDMLGSGRHKIETPEQFEKSKQVVQKLNLDGVVVIGGDDSNTNAALLAEYFQSQHMKTCVVGCPKTIDGDLKCPPYIPVSFGFDTACRTYAELCSNVAVDAQSTQKYYHFVRLMGRSASNIPLEVALLSHPNMCLIGEEIMRDNISLRSITLEIVSMIIARSLLGKNYGVVVLPEGLIEFIPEFKDLISEINEILSRGDADEEAVSAAMSEHNRDVFYYLPVFIRQQLLLDRDPHGNVQVAKIETEKLLSVTVEVELEIARKEGRYSGWFKPQFHAFGYEGRAGPPSVFDANYCYTLGYTAASLVADNQTGVIASVRNLTAPVEDWQCGGVPVVSLCVIERRKGKNVPVIRKALVELEGTLSQPFQRWKSIRDDLKLNDAYRMQMPMQFNQHAMGYDAIPETLRLELGGKPSVIAQRDAPKKMAVPFPTPDGNFLYYGNRVRTEVEEWRAKQPYQLPSVLRNGIHGIRLRDGEITQCPLVQDGPFLMKQLPRVYGLPMLFFGKSSGQVPVKPSGNIGVVYCGRQAPGGHDIVHGIVSSAPKGWNILGFVGGTDGLLAKQHVILTPERTETYARTGGLEMLGRTQDKLVGRVGGKEAVKKVCEELQLDALVLIGGARTNTDAVLLAEYLQQQACKTAISVVPMGIGGSLQSPFIQQSIGFDSNCRAVARLVGNTAVDGASARKYWYFLRIMEGSSSGRRTPTSHVTLEVALQTKPNYCIFSEVIKNNRDSLADVVNNFCDVICMRAGNGKNFGTVLVPDNMLGAVSEFSTLLQELQQIHLPQPLDAVLPLVSAFSGALLQSLPDLICKQLLSTKQSNALLALSQVDTEQLLAEFVARELKKRKAEGNYNGSFSAVCQFLGYQARCSVPSNFDSNLAYSLGSAACCLATQGKSGYMVSASGLYNEPSDWKLIGVPITALLQVGARNEPAVIPKNINLNGPAFQTWQKLAHHAASEELYENPGPIQFAGCTKHSVTQHIQSLSDADNYVLQLTKLSEKLAEISAACRPGCETRQLRLANSALDNLRTVLHEISDGDRAIIPLQDDESPVHMKH